MVVKRLLGVVAVVALVALLWWRLTQQSGPVNWAVDKLVNTAQVVSRDVPLTLQSQGFIQSDVTVDVRPQVSGMIIEAHVQSGQYVKEGDLLFTIDARPYKAEVERAEATLKKDMASLEYAKKRVERYRSLLSKDYVSKLNYEQYISEAEALKNQIDVDKAELERAKINLGWTEITAPITGKVSNFEIYPGNVVYPNDGRAITVIKPFDPIKVRFTLSQQDFQKLERYKSDKAFKVQFFFNENEKTSEQEGKINFIDNTFSTNTGTIALKGVFPNENLELWPGEYGYVKVTLTHLKNAVLVPARAIERGQYQRDFVFVLNDDSTVEVRTVRLADKIQEEFVVLEGLKAGDVVVTEGQLDLKAGNKVKVKVKEQRDQIGAAKP